MASRGRPTAAGSSEPVRLADVASLAGVSVGTASKALSGAGQLRDETRARVRQAADRLGFHRNAMARALVSGRTYAVGVLTTDSFGRFSIPMMLGAEDALGRGEMAVVLCDSRDDPLREQHYVRTLLERRVDGIIVTGRRTDPRPPLSPAVDVPVVYAYTPSSDPGDCSVVPDEVGGTRQAVEHLLGLGRTRLAVVTGPRHHRSAEVRAAAVDERLAEAGLTVAAPAAFGAWTEASGRQAAAGLMRVVGSGAGEGLDGVVCGSDQVARGVVDALREGGRRVPDDVAVVGFDDWEVMTEASRPPLTSVDMRLQALGERAARLLLDSIGSGQPPEPGEHSLPCRLVVRGSTQPA